MYHVNRLNIPPTRSPKLPIMRISLSLLLVLQWTSAFHPASPRRMTNLRFHPPSSSITTIPSSSRSSSSRSSSISTRSSPSTQLFSSKGKARFSSTITSTSILDSILTFCSSDFGGVVLGAIGLLVCLGNRFTHLDYLDATSAQVVEEAGRQSRSDLLAVFATMAVFLNGVSKLDVTSALAESVVLEGVMVSDTECTFVKEEDYNGEILDQVNWAILSVLDATPAKTAMLLQYPPTTAQWTPMAFGGIVPETDLSDILPPQTPILDRFVLDATKQRLRKESYLPTLQALPGKTEFTYLPVNTQEALLLPVRMPEEGATGATDETVAVSVLVLGSDTAKSFSPRDVAWCQLVTARIGMLL